MSLDASLNTDYINYSTKLINNKPMPIVVIYNHKECVHKDFKLMMILDDGNLVKKSVM